MIQFASKNYTNWYLRKHSKKKEKPNGNHTIRN